MLNRSASGQNDLDLLIQYSDAQGFEKVIRNLGFLEAVARHQEQLPGITHYYALDNLSGCMVHLHRHYQLIVGDDFTKNYHLPLETPFLQSSIQQDLFRVPTPELELIVFVIRMMLKRPILDHNSQRVLDPYANRELAYLQERIQKQKLYTALQSYLPQVSVELWQESTRSLHTPFSWWERTKIGWKLRQALKGFRRRSLIPEIALKAWCRFSSAMRIRLTGKLPRKILARGGAIIAIVGGDGAGKSTVVQGLAEWLAKDFEVLQAHMGKPPKQWGTYVVDFVIKIASYIIKMLRKDGDKQLLPTSHDTSWLECLLMLRSVCTARDRERLKARMHHFALRGGIVFCDRYHLPWIKLMDSPQLDRYLESTAPKHATLRIGRFLAQTEERIYQRITAPDILLVLKLRPEVAIQRKPGENADSVRNRSQEIWDINWGQTPARVIDASHSPTEVLSAIKTAVWQSLQAGDNSNKIRAFSRRQPE